LEALQAWAESSFERLKPLLAQRKAEGFIRECHGDIHLGNATVIDGKVVIFDCIEFNEPFRFTDVYADTGFLAMDLEDRGLKCLARRFISQYLELTGDYQGLELLNFYKAYRALVRAKVALFSMPADATAVQRATTLRQYRNYANLAESYSAIPSRFWPSPTAFRRSAKATWPCAWWKRWARFACAQMSNASVCSASRPFRMTCRPAFMR
jgi:aminoglycoside phosphotransferase family enzyme